MPELRRKMAVLISGISGLRDGNRLCKIAEFPLDGAGNLDSFRIWEQKNEGGMRIKMQYTLFKWNFIVWLWDW